MNQCLRYFLLFKNWHKWIDTLIFGDKCWLSVDTPKEQVGLREIFQTNSLETFFPGKCSLGVRLAFRAYSWTFQELLVNFKRYITLRSTPCRSLCRTEDTRNVPRRTKHERTRARLNVKRRNLGIFGQGSDWRRVCVEAEAGGRGAGVT